MIEKISTMAATLQGEGAYVVLAKAKELEKMGKSIVHLEIGQPDFPTPLPIVEAAIESLKRGETYYAPTLGLRELREVIADRESRVHGVPVVANQIVVCPGAKTGLFLTMSAVLNPGDEVIIPNPGFPAYENISHFLGAIPVSLPLVEEKNFSFDRDTFLGLLTDKTKLVILNSPSNPTGGLIPLEDLQFVAELARERGFFVLSDEIYDELSFKNEKVPSIYNLPGMADRVLIVNGFSKTYAMPGWRLGYIVAPEAMIPAIENLAVNTFSCTSTFSQRAAIVAIRDVTDIEVMQKEYLRRRDYLITALNDIPGVSCTVPEGAFYAFPNVSSFGKPSAEIGDHLLRAGVALLAGTYFGKHGEGYLRLSYATSMDILEEGIARMRSGLSTL
jgi:aspartate aminotransferase